MPNIHAPDGPESDVRRLARIAVIAAGVQAMTAEESKAPTVLGLVRTWTWNGKPVVLGQALEPGAVLTGQAAGSIFVSCPGAPDQYGCDTEDCPVTVCKPGSTSTLSKIFDASAEWAASVRDGIYSIYLREPNRVVTMISRGVADPQDAVVAINGSAVDLASALASVDARVLALTLVSPSGQAYPLRIEWSGQGSAVAPAPSSPGLYKLRGPSPQAEAWVLLLPPARFAKASPRFASFETLASRLRSRGVRPSHIASLRRALLLSLAAEARVPR